MIPTKEENPTGLHQKYILTKADGSPVDEGAEYFVLRLDDEGDPAHVRACWHAMLTYAKEIEKVLPDLAADIERRYANRFVYCLTL